MKLRIHETLRSTPRHWIAIAALLISVFSLYHDVDQDNKIDEVANTTQALTFRPHLTVYRIPDVDPHPFDPTPIKDGNPDTSTIAFRVRLKCVARVLNDGNCGALLQAQAWTDTVSGGPTIRSVLRDPASLETLHFQPFPDFYNLRELQPDDTLSLAFNHVVRKATDATFVLHLLMLYENDAGQLYDTYYWARYRLKQPVASVQLRRTAHGVRAEWGWRRSDLIEYVDQNESSYVYAREEAESIRNAVRRAS